MRRDLQVMEQEREARLPGRWGGPGASARGCYTEFETQHFGGNRWNLTLFSDKARKH